MYKTIKLKENLNINFKGLVDFLMPEMIYVSFDKVSEVKVSVGDLVYKDTVVVNSFREGKKFSSVSGKVIEINNEYVVVLNDYTENYLNDRGMKREVNYNILDIHNQLITFNFLNNRVIDDLLSNKKNIVIIGLSDIPYQRSREFLLTKYQDELLEVSEILFDLIKPENFIMILSSSDDLVIDKYSNVTGLYPFIKYNYFNKEYPLYFLDVLASKLNIKEEETLFITIEELLEIYYIVKKNKPIDFTLVTVVSEFLESFVARVKLYSSVSKVLETCEGTVILNNCLNGQVVSDNYIIDKNTKAFYVVNDSSKNSLECSYCGKCVSVCPFSLDPQKNDIKCRDCGLCSYYCPVNRALGKRGLDA